MAEDEEGKEGGSKEENVSVTWVRRVLVIVENRM